MDLEQFVKTYCKACGGNLTGMLLSGIEAYDKAFHDAMPNKTYSFGEVLAILKNDLGIKMGPEC